tara:strand:+ start:79 stop:369 length:291 start_codon:yes stop_codon:yes gene_type:complete
MNTPDDIQKIIKEYSMPIYKIPLHYRAICFYDIYFLLICLNFTPYTNNIEPLANTFYEDDLLRADIDNDNFFIYCDSRITILNEITLPSECIEILE